MLLLYYILRKKSIPFSNFFQELFGFFEKNAFFGENNGKGCFNAAFLAQNDRQKGRCSGIFSCLPARLQSFVPLLLLFFLPFFYICRGSDKIQPFFSGIMKKKRVCRKADLRKG
jgi:hypothetical protein